LTFGVRVGITIMVGKCEVAVGVAGVEVTVEVLMWR
jgi:hypothetical protein